MAKAKKQKVKRSTKPQSKFVVLQSPGNPGMAVTVASEFADDKMIESEIMGEVLPHFIYEFQQEGKPVRGLSVKGVSEVVRRINRNSKSGSKIRINPAHITKEEKTYDGEKGIEVTVFAEDLVSGNSAWGLKFEPYQKHGKNGPYKNTFAVEKALSKAERNAKRKLIPEQLCVSMMAKMIKESPSNVRQIEAPRQSVYQQPPAPAMTPAEMFEKAKLMISNSFDLNGLIDYDQKLKTSTSFSSEQKKQLHAIINARVDSLSAKK